MAQVDFSNAHIECISTDAFVYTTVGNFGLLQEIYQYKPEDPGWLPSTVTQRFATAVGLNNIINVSATRYTIVRTGTCTKAGNAMGIYYNNHFWWIITNISFEAGDTFSFQIDVNFNSL